MCHHHISVRAHLQKAEVYCKRNLMSRSVIADNTQPALLSDLHICKWITSPQAPMLIQTIGQQRGVAHSGVG